MDLENHPNRWKLDQIHNFTKQWTDGQWTPRSWALQLPESKIIIWLWDYAKNAPTETNALF